MILAYRVAGYFALLSIFGVLIYGFRFDPAAPWSNYLVNLLLYGAWVGVHLFMTTDRFKRAAYGDRIGTPFERQVFIAVTVVSWLALLGLHRPLPGGALLLSGPVRFAATVGCAFAVFAFFEGATFTTVDGFLGVPGTNLTLAHGESAPLLTEGRYASVRHPQYQAALGAGLCSLLVHTNAAQAFWCTLIGGTFIAFIPFEEARLIARRGEAYLAYSQNTPWRLLRGVW